MMKLGLWLMPTHPTGRPHVDGLAENTEKALLAEALGFDEPWVGEHLGRNPDPRRWRGARNVVPALPGREADEPGATARPGIAAARPGPG